VTQSLEATVDGLHSAGQMDMHRNMTTTKIIVERYPALVFDSGIPCESYQPMVLLHHAFGWICKRLSSPFARAMA
jgi:hypothetical protein